MDNKILTSFSDVRGEIGLFGGSFDPIHIGHLETARAFINALNLDYCVLVPTHQNPLKDSAPQASDLDRLKMIELALKDSDKLFVSPIELNLSEEDKSNSPSYTIDTLRKIKKEIPEKSNLYLFIGSDVLQSFHLWKEPDKICQLVKVVTYQREDVSLIKHNFNIFKSLSLPLRNISATQIRDKIKSAEEVSDLLPQKVAEYIKKNGLYIRE